MIPFEEALAAVDAIRPAIRSESVPAFEALGRRTAEAIVASFVSPPFSNSAMDGYAVGSLSGPWQWVASVPAGSAPEPLEPGQAARIFTGAMVPAGTVAVIPQEDARVDGSLVIGTAAEGRHIRRQGEELRQGDLLVSEGTRIDPLVLSVLAAFGIDRVPLRAMPGVALVSTGAELLAPGDSARPGKIFESNSATLAAVLRAWGCHVTSHRLGDDPVSGTHSLGDVLTGHAVLITIGGISVGDFDWVHHAVSTLGFEPQFRGVAIKPGKPVAMGTRSDGKVWFGLPGNPVSAIVTFCLFVARFFDEDGTWSEVPLAQAWDHVSGREEFVPADLVDTVRPRRLVGSHAIVGALGSDGLVRIGGDRMAGDTVPFARWPWGLR